MRKKVLFVCYGLGIGGIETCLVNLLNQLADKDMDIDVLLMNPIYDLQDRLKAKNVFFLPVFDYVLNTTDVMPYIRKHGGVVRNLLLFFRYIVYRILVKIHFPKPWLLFKKLPAAYDVAIAYSANGSTQYYVIDRVTARKKVFFNHNGLYEQSPKIYKRDRHYIPAYDQIVSVSTDAMKNLNSFFQIEDKSVVLKNIVDIKLIREKAEEFFPESYESGFTHIVTVGRMVEQKQPFRAVEVCENLVNSGYKIKWHWVGNGNLEASIRRIIEEKKLQGCFIPEGNRSNPYPYIKNADIYVQSSRHEAYCTTTTEARVLFRPVVTTDVGGMRDQIESGKNGIITEVSDEALTQGVKLLLDDAVLRENIISNLKMENHDSCIKPYMDYVFN